MNIRRFRAIKVHYGKMTLKIYTKGGRVLRSGVILYNTKAYRWGRSLPCFPEIVIRLRGILERFLDAVGCMDTCFVSDDTLEKLPPTEAEPGSSEPAPHAPRSGGGSGSGAARSATSPLQKVYKP